MTGRFVIFVKCGNDKVGHERSFDARHATWLLAQREIEHSKPAPPGCEYFVVEEPEPDTDPLGIKKKKKPRIYGR